MNVFSPNNVLMTIVLVFLTIVLFIIVIPFLLIVAICCLFSYIIMGISPLVLFNRHKEHRHDMIYEGPYRQDPLQDAPASSAGSDNDNDAIECEVISVRTVEKEGDEPDCR